MIDKTKVETAYEEILTVYEKYGVRIEWMEYAWCSLTDGEISIPIKR